MISPQEALERLSEGNRRFVSNVSSHESSSSEMRRRELMAGQQPFAVIVGCSDSRVPAEIIFDQGLGDLFVIRIAGNIVAPSQIGSVEFAVEYCHTKLVVVLGHTQCGAIRAALDEVTRPKKEKRVHHLDSIVKRIRPTIKALIENETQPTREKLLEKAVRANVQVSLHALRNGSPFIEEKIKAKQLLVVGAEYSLETGRVEFFDHKL